MFKGCTSLVYYNEWDLPATTLANQCYLSMFEGCTSLRTGPGLLAANLVHQCYYEMFKNCSSLNTIRCLAENIGTGNCYNWVSGVSSSGDFTYKSGVVWPDGVNGIPTGWVKHPA